MKLKIILTILILSIMVTACSTPTAEVVKEELDERCEWKPGRCTGIHIGYYMLGNSCKPYDGKACSPPPFTSKVECEKVCLQ